VINLLDGAAIVRVAEIKHILRNYATRAVNWFGA